ncbi:aminotransferase class V-fold PLP-dependent enzyme [Sinomicrobium weinanense]|uniref:PLP-dependent transferase n=1 Tax=Sinomicrobium weinanense TaxID=2842200 RepID=A0A926JT78_9FLAO|nr:aminotransferase class V-fold PLP-dependent enzyme [Sinomicrobium weinanense]MBC9796812.1 PLP-dependent transferase [Sinomicrobium weinanense]MBU3123684.1 PLP-dependent transferase [Sinomicrobium weinanense]
MISRRRLIQQLSALPLMGGLMSFDLAGASRLIQPGATTPATRNYFQELGIRTFINAAGTYTSMTGSLMTDEVKQAYLETSEDFVDIDELQDKVGERIASLLGCEAATVTSGASSAITLGTAGVLTGTDPEKAKKLPHLQGTGMKTEVIMQRKHYIDYAHAMENCGVKIVYVDTKDELKKAINRNTAMYYFVNFLNYEGQIQWEDVLEVCQAHKIPTMIDCAADAPPAESLSKYTDMGFDMVCFSGGKGLRGPQSAGVLLGKKKYIEAARVSAPPRANTVGRGMKVNKEEIVAMMVAIESYLKRDHKKDWALWENQVNLIKKGVDDIPGLKAKIDVPVLANVVPTLNLSWNTKQVKISGDQLKEEMRKGHPSIEIAGGGKNSVSITTWMLKPGQERIVASRLSEILHQKSM